MSLELLGLLVVFGISAVVMLVHFTGGSRLAQLGADTEVLTAWGADWDLDKPLEILRNNTGSAAIVVLPDNALGLIWSFGADTVSRKLTPGSVRSITPRGEALILRFRDFDCPAAHIPLTRRELPIWHDRLSPYLQKETAHG